MRATGLSGWPVRVPVRLPERGSRGELSPSPVRLVCSSTAARMPLGPVAARRDSGRMGHVIGFVPASGGVGASTLAAAVAVRAAAAGRSVVAVDLDRVGGRLDVVFGVEQLPGWRWNRLAAVAGLVDGTGLARQLPITNGVSVLAAGMVARVARVAADAAAGDGSGRDATAPPGGGPRTRDWLEVVPDVVGGLVRAHDLTVLDLPREPAVAAAVAAQLDALVVVAGSKVGQLAAAARSVPTLRAAIGDEPRSRAAAASGRSWSSEPAQTWLVLRGTRVEAALEDAVVDHLDLSLAGVVRDEPRVAVDAERGAPPGARGRGSLVEVADALLLQVLTRELAA